MSKFPRNSSDMHPVPPKSRPVLVQRNPLPQVNDMVSDAYTTLSTQLGHFKRLSYEGAFSINQATAFQKIVGTFNSLQDLERRNTALLELGNMSPAELEALTVQATNLLNPEKSDAGTVAPSATATVAPYERR